VILKAAWVVPVTTPPVRHGYVELEGDRIVALGPMDQHSILPQTVTDLGDVVLQTMDYDAGEGMLRGYASVAGFPDAYKEIVDYGAFKKTLKDHEDRILFCWQHDWREPIGKPQLLKEVPKSRLPKGLLDEYPDATGGLYIETEIVPTRRGEDAKRLLKAGVLTELSIGFDVVQEYEGEDGYWHLSEIELFEVSLVSMAAMPAAQVIEYKGQQCDLEPEHGKPEETEDYIRVPNPGVGDCSVTATITISEKEGIKALYCGEVKKIRTFLFAKDHDWTMEKAEAWVKEHAEEYKATEMAHALIELVERGSFHEALTLLQDLIALAESPRTAQGQGEAMALWIRVHEAMLEQS